MAHWAAVNAALLPGGPLILKTGQGDADLADQRESLMNIHATLQSELNGLQIARATILGHKEAMHGWLNKFIEVVDAYFGGTPLGAARPKVPGMGVAQQEFVDAMLEAGDLWLRINAVVPAPPGLTLPLTLPSQGGTTVTLAAFQARLAALQAAYAGLKGPENSLRIKRGERDALQGQIKEGLKIYRQAVTARFAEGSALILSLPKLSPPEGGRTPAPVEASAVLVPPDEARVVYEASPDPDLARYELRGVAGDEWNAEDAVVVAMHNPDEPRVFLTGFSLTQPGAAASFSVHVVLDSGHGRGSAPMTVMRPLV